MLTLVYTHAPLLRRRFFWCVNAQSGHAFMGIPPVYRCQRSGVVVRSRWRYPWHVHVFYVWFCAPGVPDC